MGFLLLIIPKDYVQLLEVIFYLHHPMRMIMRIHCNTTYCWTNSQTSWFTSFINTRIQWIELEIIPIIQIQKIETVIFQPDFNFNVITLFLRALKITLVPAARANFPPVNGKYSTLLINENNVIYDKGIEAPVPLLSNSYLSLKSYHNKFHLLKKLFQLIMNNY